MLCFFPFILDIKFVGRTSRGHTGGRSHRISHTGFLIHLPSAVHALIFLARRIQPSLSLVDREVEFCELTVSSFSTTLVGHFFFFSEKNTAYQDSNSRPNVSEGYYEVASELPGRPISARNVYIHYFKYCISFRSLPFTPEVLVVLACCCCVQPSIRPSPPRNRRVEFGATHHGAHPFAFHDNGAATAAYFFPLPP